MIPIVSSLLCLGLPVFGLWRMQARGPLRRPYLVSVGSFVFCGVAMLQELYTVKRRLLGNDIFGIEDTIDAVLALCAVLLILAALLNLSFLYLSFRLKEEENVPCPLPEEGAEDETA